MIKDACEMLMYDDDDFHFSPCTITQKSLGGQLSCKATTAFDDQDRDANTNTAAKTKNRGV